MDEVLVDVEPRHPSRFEIAFDKLRWGLRAVGPGRVARGAVALAGLAIRRPARSEVRLRSGTIMEFEYPAQFPPMLVMFGDLIDPEFAFLRTVIRPRWTVFDVGAAIGQFTLFAGAAGAKVHAFEPSGSNVATLARNIERNGLSATTQVHQIALSHTRGEARFETNARAWLSRLDRSTGGELVPVRRLDETMTELGVSHLPVLKINVSGYEPEVLDGAWEVLQAGQVDILILLLGLKSLPYYARIAALGYRFFYYHPGTRTLHEVTRFDAASVLDHRPWPARHIIAIRSGALAAGMAAGTPIQPLGEGQ